MNLNISIISCVILFYFAIINIEILYNPANDECSKIRLSKDNDSYNLINPGGGKLRGDS